MGVQPLLALLTALGAFWILGLLAGSRFGRGIETIRDWLPMALTVCAFREMELFVTRHYNVANETVWIRLDRIVLLDWRLSAAIERLGQWAPLFLEVCYLLVYGVAIFCLIVLLRDTGHPGEVDRPSVDLYWSVYLLGTLGAYALFPFFPSEPPRYAFPEVAPPLVITWARDLNLWILGKATIHSGVFPSAHVSSAFSCAWALFLVRPRRRLLCWSMVFYAASVSLATIYGRYHYTADVLAGFAVSVAAAGVVFWWRR